MATRTREQRQASSAGRPLSLSFDMLSPAGQVAQGKARLIVNWVNNSRVPGLRRYGWDDPNGFLNQDLHDQMLGAVRDQVPRETE